MHGRFLTIFYLAVATLYIQSCKDKAKPAGSAALATTVRADTIHIGDLIFHIDTITEEEFKKAKAFVYDTSELRNLERDSAQVRRQDSTLFFKTAAGKEVTLKDVDAEDDSYSRFYYMGKINEAGQYLSYGSFYEWFNYFLISDSTGDTTILWGEPQISPDHKYIFTGNVDLDAGYTYNGFQLFTVEDRTLWLIGDVHLDNWGPSEIKWLSNTELLVKRDVWDSTQVNGIRKDYIKLSMR
jgi:hypothetical protein